MLVNPPYKGEKNYIRAVRWAEKSKGTTMHPPTYMTYAAGYLQSKGIDTHVFDSIPLGLTTEKFLNEVTRLDPKIVIIETALPSWKNDLMIAELVKKELKRPVGIIGHHVSSNPEILNKRNIDFGIIGEYELTIEKITKGVMKPKGKIQGEALKNIDFFGKWEDLDLMNYNDHYLTTPFVFLLTARGCPFRCTFCNWRWNFTKNIMRWRNIDNLINELKYCYDTFDIKSWKFYDDTFTVNKLRTKKICKKIKELNLGIKWLCNTRVDTVDYETLKVMKEAGCEWLKVGVESGNQQLLDYMQKDITIKQIKKFFKWTNDLGITTHAEFMVGLPGETKETINNTIKLIKDIKPTTIQTSIVQPFPGTPIYDDLLKKGRIKPWYDVDWLNEDGFQTDVIESQNLCMEKESRRIWSSFYLDPNFIIKRLSHPSIKDVKAGVNVLKYIFKRS